MNKKITQTARPSQKKLKWALLAVVIFLLTQLAASNCQIVESVYSQTIYPIVARILSTFSNLFPFSLDDLFYLTVLFYTGANMILLLRRKHRSKTLFRLLNTFSFLYTAFYLLWGFNYFRLPLPQRLGLAQQKTDSIQYQKFVEDYIAELNRSYLLVDAINKQISDQNIEDSYARLAPILQFTYPAGKRLAKPITFSTFFAKAGISGYFGPFFNEVHVNTQLLPVEYPFVLAHEKAHQLGITSEAEANFYAWLVCTRSKSPIVRYSGLLSGMFYLLRELKHDESYTQLIQQLSPKIKADMQLIHQHYLKLRNANIDQAASKMNDTYLKSNHIEEGIQNYNKVAQFILDYSFDPLFQQKVLDITR